MQDFTKSPDFFRIYAGTLVLKSLTVNGNVKPSGMEMADEEVSSDTVWSARRPGCVLVSGSLLEFREGSRLNIHV